MFSLCLGTLASSCSQSVRLGLWTDRGEMNLNSNHNKSSFVFFVFFVVCYFNSVSVISCYEVVGLSA